MIALLCVVSFSSVANADNIFDRIFGRKRPEPETSITPIPRAQPVPQHEEGDTPLISFPDGVRSPEWKITRTEWLPEDEIEFGRMVQMIGDDRGCKDVNSCMKRLAYRLGDQEMMTATFWSDCAKFPYLLRAYYAWRTGLPFGYVTGMSRAPITADQAKDPKNADWQTVNIRYSYNGNYPTRRSSITARGPGQFPFLENVLTSLGNSVFSATYRMSPDYQGDTFQDFYSARLTRESLTPGTVIYNPNGHVVLVYRSEADGQLWHVGAGINDGIIQRLPWGDDYPISRMAHGGGFRKFRPLRLVGAQQDRNGNYVGGRITAPRNEELPDFGLEQYKGVTADGKFQVAGKNVDIYQYVRWVVAGGVFTYDPVKEFKLAVGKVCVQVLDRIKAVENVPATMVRGPHPDTLPPSIFAGDGIFADWELHSSPSRDNRGIRGGFKSAIETAQSMMMLARQNSPNLSYAISPEDLKAKLIAQWNATATSCVLQYTKSDGTKSAPINLEEINRRAYLLSFDPYQCPERRWGATGSELKSCVDAPEEAKWYEIEQGLRNLTDNVQTTGMDVPFEQALGNPALNPVKTRPNLSIRQALEAL